jgi:riboflavin biosynthesis pyrimidine reductase
MSDGPEFALDTGALELLFERGGLPELALPPALARAYGGAMGMRRPSLFANFVSSVDGVVALGMDGESGHVISGDSAADRFVMGLLRACANAVIVGASTLRASPEHLWTPARIFPSAAEHFAELRRTLGFPPEPTFVVVTASGALDPKWPALRGAVVATTREAESRLKSELPGSRVVAFDVDPGVETERAPLPLAPLLELLRAEGAELVLTEGGPSLVARLVAEGLLDELFLTVSPALFGRFAGDAKKALVDGVDLGRKALELSSLRRCGSHLFLRYTLG